MMMNYQEWKKYRIDTKTLVCLDIHFFLIKCCNIVYSLKEKSFLITFHLITIIAIIIILIVC